MAPCSDPACGKGARSQRDPCDPLPQTLQWPSQGAGAESGGRLHASNVHSELGPTSFPPLAALVQTVH